MCLEGRTVLINGLLAQAEMYLLGYGGEKLAMLFPILYFVDGTEPKILEVYGLNCEEAFIIFEVNVKGCLVSKSVFGFLENYECNHFFLLI